MAHLLFGFLELALGLWVETASSTAAAATRLELCLELLVLFLQLSDHLGLRVLIDGWLVLDLLGIVGVPER